jgi:hypothetical protein
MGGAGSAMEVLNVCPVKLSLSVAMSFKMIQPEQPTVAVSQRYSKVIKLTVRNTPFEFKKSCKEFVMAGTHQLKSIVGRRTTRSSRFSKTALSRLANQAQA